MKKAKLFVDFDHFATATKHAGRHRASSTSPALWVVLILILTVFALAGCADNDMIFYKPEMTLRMYAKDSYECERDARQVRYGRYESAADFAIKCMRARGWAYISSSALTPQAVARIRAQWNDQ